MVIQVDVSFPTPVLKAYRNTLCLEGCGSRHRGVKREKWFLEKNCHHKWPISSFRSPGAKNMENFRQKTGLRQAVLKWWVWKASDLLEESIVSVSIFRDAPSCFKRFNLAQVSITSQDFWVWTWCAIYSVKYDSNMDNMWDITQSRRISSTPISGKL